MSSREPERGSDALPEARPGTALRLRIWLGCLGGSLVAGGGIWWVVGAHAGPVRELDLAAVVAWLGAVGGLSLLAGAAFALWLDRGIVSHARGLAEAARTRQTAALRGLPATAGWGELSLLTQQIQQLLGRLRQAERAAEELGVVRDQLAGLAESLDRWKETERWRELRLENSPVASVSEALDRGLRRLEEVREQNLEAARKVSAELAEAAEAARDAAEQTERGFVESTVLLTTVRELQRLAVELGQAVTAPAPQGSDAMAPARAAIQDLVSGSAEVVEQLARALRKVEEIADEVPVIANRATLIALAAALPGRPPDAAERAEEGRRLALEVRTALQKTTALRGELEEEVKSAIGRMRELRGRVTARLEALEAAPAPPAGDVARLLDRVREMIQDAARKGERLSSSGERASRAAEALLRRMEAETREMEGLMARLAPPPETPVEDPPALPELRLLDTDAGLTEPDRHEARPGEEPR